MATSGSCRDWIFRTRRFQGLTRPLLMGVVNITPDSFSDGGQFLQVDAAVERAIKLAQDGADILDIGGESTRPGAIPVALDDELARVVPVVRRLAKTVGIPISIDTTKSDVARQCIDAGAEIVNDISGLLFDPEMVSVCRDSTVGIVCMHIQGRPATMQASPHYNDIIAEICNYFRSRLDRLGQEGIASERVMLDPGVGFGKTAAHNLEILSHIGNFHQLGRPVLIGHSRKRFLKSLLGREVDERLAGGLGVSLALAVQGVECLRVHDVASHRDALIAWETVLARTDKQPADDQPQSI